MSAHPTNHNSERLAETSRLSEDSRDQAAHQRLGETSRETRRRGKRYTVQGAAEALGTTVDAVRGRIRRGTLDSMKVDGVVYVLLDEASREQHSDESATGQVAGRQQTDDKSELVASLRERVLTHEDQIEWLRREVERKDTIIMSLTQRVPELSPAASQEAPGSPQADAAGSEEVREGGQERSSQQGQEAPQRQRSALMRFFFGP